MPIGGTALFFFFFFLLRGGHCVYWGVEWNAFLDTPLLLTSPLCRCCHIVTPDPFQLHIFCHILRFFIKKPRLVVAPPVDAAFARLSTRGYKTGVVADHYIASIVTIEISVIKKRMS
jgi:hypothetical protein